MADDGRSLSLAGGGARRRRVCGGGRRRSQGERSKPWVLIGGVGLKKKRVMWGGSGNGGVVEPMGKDGVCVVVPEEIGKGGRPRSSVW